MDTLRHDLLYALRSLRRNPGFAAVAVLTLALGIGANSAIFSVVNAVLLRPLPYAQPERLVTAGYMMNGEYLQLRERARLVRDPALYSASGFNLSDEREADRVDGAYVSTNLFSLLGVAPRLGRTLLPGEERPGAGRVVVIGEGIWRQRFGADPGVIGREITVDSERRTVVGVMPAGFRFPTAGTGIWVPVTLDAGNPAALWGGGGGEVIARLAPRAVPAQAQAELRALAPEFRKANTLWVPAPDWGLDREVVLLQDTMTVDVRTGMLILLGAVGLVLLIACGNIANLLLARAAARRREVAVRNALGADRRRIVRQLLTESALLGLVGGALGLLLAYGGIRLLVGSLPADTPRIAEIGIDRSVLGFTLAVSLVASLLFGLAPALKSSRPDVQGALKEGGGGSTAAHHRISGALVVTELAIAVVLVVGAGLLVRSFVKLVRVDPGFRTESIVTAHVTPPASRYGAPAKQRVFYDAVLARVGALPGVRNVDAVSQLPLADGFEGVAFEIEGRPYAPGAKPPVFWDRKITPGYPRTMGIPLLRGRALTDADREGAPTVALINETMARAFWPGEDPVGKRFKEVWLNKWTTVVGVVGDVKSLGLTGAVEPEIYRPFRQLPTRDLSLVVRAQGDPMAVAALLRAAVASVDAQVPVSEIRTAEQIVATSVAEPRFTMFLLASFATLALALAAVGVYGVISYAVSRRTREIGVRVAMGALRTDVVRMVLRQALVLAAVGTAVGVAAALAMTRVLRSLLFEVSTTDAVTLVGAPLLLVGVALAAAYVPARRAARVDPVIALRGE